ncbi:hypothetical protein PARU111607_18085 [Palleronia rufa]
MTRLEGRNVSLPAQGRYSVRFGRVGVKIPLSPPDFNGRPRTHRATAPDFDC